jgi:hypothetical protein
MVASARPVLHYVLDRPGTAERTLTVRPSGFSWPIAGNNQRDIQLQFVTTTEPAALDPVQKTASAQAGTTAAPGRIYPLTFPRSYPAGSESPTTGTIHPSGDLTIKPLLRIYGPLTGATVQLTPSGQPTFTVGFLPSFQIGIGAWVDIDCDQKTAWYNSDTTQNVLTNLDWVHLIWPVLPPGVDTAMVLTGVGPSQVTQVQASWYDRYLT